MTSRFCNRRAFKTTTTSSTFALIAASVFTLATFTAPHTHQAKAQDLGSALLDAFSNLEEDTPSEAAPISEDQYNDVLETLAGNAKKTEILPTTEKQRDLWADFNHYVRIARPELAKAAADALLADATPQQLLDVVEASDYADYEQTLLRAAKVQTLADTVDAVSNTLQEARVDRSRDERRIANDISKLAEGARANANAINRLAAAGQYAAPLLLKTLTDESLTRLHPYAVAAMVSIGRPMVYPLASAIGDLEPVAQGQVAQVLAEIGYPRALPYLKAVIENPRTDPSAREKVISAFNVLSENLNLPNNIAASELFLTLGENLYSLQTDGGLAAGYDAAIGKGLVWEYGSSTGLVYVPVPGQIFGDVLAHRAARKALLLNENLDPALSLWLAANLRRQNSLKEAEIDPSYPTQYQPPKFYIEMAGPLRQHDVLERALSADDTALALDAIGALRATAGVDALVNRPGTVQPLLRSLSYPDRRVRFAAAFTLTRARPTSTFSGSNRVVPVLAEAIRQSDKRYALVISDDPDRLNSFNAALDDLGYIAFGGPTLDSVAQTINSGPGVDLIITDRDVPGIQNLLRDTATHYKLGAVPIVAVVTEAAEVRLSYELADESRLTPTRDTGDLQTLGSAIAAAAKSYTGNALTSEEADAFATESLELLASIALLPQTVYNVKEAEPALIEALADPREFVVELAARVLALIDSPGAQDAIADSALSNQTSLDLQIALLGSLADSAKRYGSQLDNTRLDTLLELVKTANGDTAIAAAVAHGALTLPTANVIELIKQ